MAMIKCHECSNPVSNQAKACPACGVKPRKESKILKWFGAFLIVSFSISAFSAMINNTSNSNPTQPVSAEATYSEKWRQDAWNDESEKAIRAKLKDPQSAEFRNVFFKISTLEGKRLPMTCGEVNSKNSFGGYSGFKRFVAAGSTGIAILEEEVADFHNVWNSLCAN